MTPSGRYPQYRAPTGDGQTLCALFDPSGEAAHQRDGDDHRQKNTDVKADANEEDVFMFADARAVERLAVYPR